MRATTSMEPMSRVRAIANVEPIALMQATLEMKPDTAAPLYGGVHLSSIPDLPNVYRLDQNAIPMILDMQRNGIKVDGGYFRALR